MHPLILTQDTEISFLAAIGSLIFAYVLGQQSLYSEISPQKEKELAKKMGKLDTFVDKQENR